MDDVLRTGYLPAARHEEPTGGLSVGPSTSYCRANFSVVHISGAPE
jgi:hypothetical protein